MLTVVLGATALELAISGVDVLLALARNIQVPYAQIRSVSVRPESAGAWFSGIRAGTHFPSWVKKGRFWNSKGVDFFFLCNKHNTVGLILEPDSVVKYREIVFEVPKGSPKATPFRSLGFLKLRATGLSDAPADCGKSSPASRAVHVL